MNPSWLVSVWPLAKLYERSTLSMLTSMLTPFRRFCRVWFQSIHSVQHSSPARDVQLPQPASSCPPTAHQAVIIRRRPARWQGDSVRSTIAIGSIRIYRILQATNTWQKSGNVSVFRDATGREELGLHNRSRVRIFALAVRQMFPRNTGATDKRPDQIIVKLRAHNWHG
jgi:hypothetical protein